MQESTTLRNSSCWVTNPARAELLVKTRHCLAWQISITTTIDGEGMWILFSASQLGLLDLRQLAFMVTLYRIRQHVKTSKTKVSFKPTLAASWTLVLLLSLITSTTGLRCYVCGGSTGRECEDIVTRRWSPYVRPRPVLTSDGKRQWEECNDLINNKGCIKQVVNGGEHKALEASYTKNLKKARDFRLKYTTFSCPETWETWEEACNPRAFFTQNKKKKFETCFFCCKKCL